jgi:hypothetical protein
LTFARQVIIPRQLVSEVASAKENSRRKFFRVELGHCDTPRGCRFLPDTESNASESISDLQKSLNVSSARSIFFTDFVVDLSPPTAILTYGSSAGRETTASRNLSHCGASIL